MVDCGLIQETDDLFSSGLLARESSPGRSIGYQETIQFLESGRSIEDFKQYLRGFQAVTRQYSRRQETWFRRLSEFKWIERPNLGQSLSDQFLDRIVKWYKLGKNDYVKDISAVDMRTRDLISSDKETNSKRMKKYSSMPEIFDSDSKISEFLASLNLD
jgi:tRNA A37 N6-isopentenylltransferase MiaA